MKIFWSVLSMHECSVCSSRVSDRGEWVLENIWEIYGKEIKKKEKLIFGRKLKKHNTGREKEELKTMFFFLSNLKFLFKTSKQLGFRPSVSPEWSYGC